VPVPHAVTVDHLCTGRLCIYYEAYVGDDRQCLFTPLRRMCQSKKCRDLSGYGWVSTRASSKQLALLFLVDPYYEPTKRSSAELCGVSFKI